MGMKSIALATARPRSYSDLRAAAALGGYYFNLTRLEPHLELSDDVLPANFSCDAAGAARGASLVSSTPQSQYFLTRVAASF